ncbi:MAG TPA: L,D-transpeptidase family protein [Actinomycetota bacterium]|nr:L,D-transpeptidase family protein [Actinomycetota bacterium]
MKVRMRTTLPALLVAALVLPAAPAAAQEAPTGVTLKAGRRIMDFGESVMLRGRIDPPSEGETISLVDSEGRERATATTDAEGRYRVRVAPRRTTQYTARWLALVSTPVTVKVRPKVTVSLRAVRLFGTAQIRGTVRPVQESGRAAVTLRRDGRALWTRRLELRDGRRFSTKFDVGKVGRFAVGASFTDASDVRGSDRSAVRATPLPYLSEGARGVFVRLLESRLCELRYKLLGCDRRFSTDTADAVRAFNKVEGRARLGTVDSSTWAALSRAKVARARYRTKGFHIEVDQTRQVLLMVRDGKVTAVLHTSTGANGATRDGTFRVYRKLAGYSPNRLYYPSYFDGLRALHGWPEVPTYPASHGCARLPMWSATWVYEKADIGTTIHVYH